MSQSTDSFVEREIKPYARDWEPPTPYEERYSADQVINAYQIGFLKGQDSVQDLVKERFQKNVEQAAVFTLQIIERLRTLKVEPTAAWLKIISWDAFEVLFTVPEVGFISDRFREVYSYVGELEQAARAERTCISFTFCPETEHFDLGAVKAEGFSLRHKALLKSS
jgi:hypothetical protein